MVDGHLDALEGMMDEGGGSTSHRPNPMDGPCRTLAEEEASNPVPNWEKHRLVQRKEGGSVAWRRSTPLEWKPGNPSGPDRQVDEEAGGEVGTWRTRRSSRTGREEGTRHSVPRF